jgi:hypothetical protein
LVLEVSWVREGSFVEDEEVGGGREHIIDQDTE